ncbi:MAG: PAS domain-containing protein, partial [Gemmatimonadaceae bacterium]
MTKTLVRPATRKASTVAPRRSNAEKVEIQELRAQLDEANRERRNADGVLSVLVQSYALIEFDLTGNIIVANDNFLKLMGYDLNEIIGKHHRMFSDVAYTSSKPYEKFWNDLRAGHARVGVVKRAAKSGKEVWLQATYAPVKDENNVVVKVVKFAIDVTEEKLASANAEEQLNAINKAQPVVEFNLDGTVIIANDKFLHAMDYRLDEVIGKHHSFFVDPTHVETAEYRTLWAELNAGNHQSAEAKRIG